MVLDFADVLTAGGLAAFGKVIMIDLMMAGDNVVILGTVAAGLPLKDRKRVLAVGVAIALVCLIGFALLATTLLKITGLLLAGGLLLLWVAWRLFRELHPARSQTIDDPDTIEIERPRATKTFGAAVIQVVIADLSMSLDNVLAVAGAARDHPAVLVFGLGLSVTLMAVAASYIARLIERYHWIAYIGLAVILYVAVTMIVDGWNDVHPAVMTLLAG